MLQSRTWTSYVIEIVFNEIENKSGLVWNVCSESASPQQFCSFQVESLAITHDIICFFSLQKMDDLYSFGRSKYNPADPIQRSIFRYLKNVSLVLYTFVKCTFFGIFIILKSLLFVFIPRSWKDIQNQVALVSFHMIWNITIELANWHPFVFTLNIW